MKEETITLRVDSELKENFKKICENEKTDMSDKLYQFINEEVKTKKIVSIETKFEELLEMLGYNNIKIITSPFCEINDKAYNVNTMKFDDIIKFSDFLIKNENNEIYIYLIGSELPNYIRLIVVDK